MNKIFDARTESAVGNEYRYMMSLNKNQQQWLPCYFMVHWIFIKLPKFGLLGRVFSRWRQIQIPEDLVEFDKYKVSISTSEQQYDVPRTSGTVNSMEFNEGLESGHSYEVTVKTVSGNVTSWRQIMTVHVRFSSSTFVFIFLTQPAEV